MQFAKWNNKYTEDEIWDMSTEIKKQDLREVKKGLTFQFSFRDKSNKNK